MASQKTLEQLMQQEDISNGDIRYMSDAVKQDILAATAKCRGTMRERIFWLQHGLNDYPNCFECSIHLTSKNFRTNVKGGTYGRFCSSKCSARSVELRAKKAQTVLDKYGATSYLASADARKKIEETNISRYGAKTPHPWGSEMFVNYIREKYGIDNIRHVDSINDKIIRAQIASNIVTGKTHSSIANCESKRMVACINVELALNESRDILEKIPLKWKHTCGAVYTSPIVDGDINGCPSCGSGCSVLELSLRNLVYETGIEFSSKDRTVLKTKELDILVPSRKLAIEFNGIYWHSAIKNGDRYYHLAKTEEALENGTRLIHIWENDFLQKTDVVKSIIYNALGVNTNKISARSCEVREMTSKEANAFLEENHLRGGLRSSSFRLGLFHKDELVQVMTFGACRFNKKYEWELHRLAGKTFTNIRGGAKKLLTHFQRIKNPKSILTYADRCLGEGNVYSSIGFTKIGSSAPSYFWACTASAFTIPRYQSQKHKLEKLLGKDFDPALSESENMKRVGWFKIWDCGNNIYEWKP